MQVKTTVELSTTEIKDAIDQFLFDKGYKTINIIFSAKPTSGYDVEVSNATVEVEKI